MGKTGRANVRILREGYFRWVEMRQVSDVTCTTTYIEDGGKKILVDVPNVGEETALLASLKQAGINPNTVDIVVVTHFHPDHDGCLHLFPNARFIGSGVEWHGAEHRYWHEEALSLTDDVYVIKTPGHTQDSCSVIANTEDGIVAMVGDMWWSLDDPKLLVVSSQEELDANRKKIITLADWIIPGHAGMGDVKSAVLEP